MDNGWMYRVYRNQAAALVHPFIFSFFFLSNFQTSQFFFKEVVLKLATNGQWYGLSVDICPQGLSAPALGLYTCIKALKYIPGPGVRWAFTGPLVLWLLLKSESFIRLQALKYQCSHCESHIKCRRERCQNWCTNFSWQWMTDPKSSWMLASFCCWGLC